jgi:hypothetical protein
MTLAAAAMATKQQRQTQALRQPPLGVDMLSSNSSIQQPAEQ